MFRNAGFHEADAQRIVTVPGVSGWELGGPESVNAPAEQLIGRAEDLSRIGALLAAPGQVTLTGFVGVGTSAVTRALAAAHGTPRCDLATEEGRHHLEQCLATPTDALTVPIGPLGRPLVVLDHCDGHWELVDAVRAHLDRPDAPVSVLAAARRRSRLPGERTYHLGGLATDTDPPGTRPSDAARLLVELIGRRAPWAPPDSADLAVIEEIARRLDGNPGALTVAAEKAALFGVPTVLMSLGDLVSSPRDGGPSIDEAVAASIDGLDHTHRRLLAALAPAPAPVGIGTIEAVCPGPGVLSGLAELMELGLVTTIQRDALAVFRLGALVRVSPSAADRVPADRDGWFTQVLAHYGTIATEAAEGSRSPRRYVRVRELLAERDTVFATLEWAERHGRVVEAAEVAADLGWTWHHGGVLKLGRVWADQLEAALRGEPAGAHVDVLRARLLMMSAIFDQRLEESTAGEDKGREALVLATRHHDTLVEAMALQTCGAYASIRNENLLARQYFQSARERFQELGDEVHLATTWFDFGHLDEAEGRFDEAIAGYRDAARVFRLYDEYALEALAHYVTASATLSQHRPSEAVGPLVRALDCAELGRVDALLPSLLLLGSAVLAAHGRHREATTANAAALATSDPVDTFGSEEAATADRTAGWTRPAAHQLGDSERAACEAHGASMGAREAVSWVRDHLIALPRTRRGPTLVMAASPPSAAASSLAELTGRELEVLEHLHLGLTNEAIAQELGVSRRTVDKHLERIFRKLGVRNRTAATYLLTTARGTAVPPV